MLKHELINDIKVSAGLQQQITLLFLNKYRLAPHIAPAPQVAQSLFLKLLVLPPDSFKTALVALASMQARGLDSPCHNPPLPRLFLEPTLGSHSLNATVSFLQPIEEPINISGAARLFAYNDRQNVFTRLSPRLAATLPAPPPSLRVTPVNSPTPAASVWKRVIPRVDASRTASL